MPPSPHKLSIPKVSNNLFTLNKTALNKNGSKRNIQEQPKRVPITWTEPKKSNKKTDQIYTGNLQDKKSTLSLRRQLTLKKDSSFSMKSLKADDDSKDQIYTNTKLDHQSSKRSLSVSAQTSSQKDIPISDTTKKQIDELNKLQDGSITTSAFQQTYADDGYIASANSIPQVTCQSYCIMIMGNKSEVILAKDDQVIKAIASLTKIVTCLVSLQLIDEFKLDPKSTYFLVSKKASQVFGTSAFLKSGQRVLLHDLFYGLMLPSGNDAATVLAENFGGIISQRRLKNQQSNNDNNFQIFMKEMNKLCHKNHLKFTKFYNPHGLARGNQSTAYEISKMSGIAMRDPRFAEIVSCKHHKCMTYLAFPKGKKAQSALSQEIKDMQESLPVENGGIPYPMQWWNTNKLLDTPGYKGVKTGFTNIAGFCLSIMYHSEAINQKLICVVLGSKNIEYRWQDTRRLTSYAEHVLQERYQNNKQNQRASAI